MRCAAAFKPKSIYGTHFVASLLTIRFYWIFVFLCQFILCVLCVCVCVVLILFLSHFSTFFPFTLAVKCNLSVDDEIVAILDSLRLKWDLTKMFLWNETIIKVKFNGHKDIVEWKTIWNATKEMVENPIVAMLFLNACIFMAFNKKSCELTFIALRYKTASNRMNVWFHWSFSFESKWIFLLNRIISYWHRVTDRIMWCLCLFL